MYRFLPYQCRSLYKMRLTQEDILATRTLSCDGEKVRRRRGRHLQQAVVEELVLWEEAQLIPALLDLFVDNKLLNVVFEWDKMEVGRATVTTPRQGFESLRVSETRETWPLTEEVSPLTVIERYENCQPRREEQRGVHRATVTQLPKKYLNYFPAFAFQVEIVFETAAELQAAPSMRCRGLADPGLGLDPRRIRVTKTEVREECNVRVRTAKHPKYFCQSCETDICKECLQDRCISHEVQWIGNHTYTCGSPNHSHGDRACSNTCF